MFSKSSKGKYAAFCGVCGTAGIVISVIAVLGSLASLVGVYMSHVRPEGIVFGDIHSSASLIALALNLFLVKKALEMCTCRCEVPTKK